MKVEKIIPFVTDYIWGGTKLIEKFGVKTDLSRAAEAWVLSMHKDGVSKLTDGTPLDKAVAKSDLGRACEKFEFFPVLVKLIDAKENLSVQVHPSDDYALKNENSFGKTEMWYVVDCEDGAGLYVGLKEDISKKLLSEKINDGTILESLNFFKVKKGDYFFIPSGTIHAIGKGCTICEVQQNSNLTYRVYDYNRLGADGKPRALHIDKAITVSDLKKYTPSKTKDGMLADCEYFCARMNYSGKDIYNENSFTNIVALSGSGKIDGCAVNAGDSYFIPAGQKARLEGNFEFMEIFVK